MNDDAPQFSVSKYLTPLDAHTAAIRHFADRAARDLVTVGQRLLICKSLLPHGEFGPWLDKEFSWSQRYAQTLMNVAKRFQDSTLPADTATSISALASLAAPSTPDAAIAEAIALLESGERITMQRAHAIIHKHRDAETSAAVRLIVETAPDGRIESAIKNSHLRAVNEVMQTLVQTGAVESVSDEEMHPLSLALDSAIVMHEYEASQRQRLHLQEKANMQNDKEQLKAFADARASGLVMPRYEVYETYDGSALLGVEINSLGTCLTLEAAKDCAAHNSPQAIVSWEKVGLLWMSKNKYGGVDAIIVTNVHTLADNEAK